MNKFIALAFVIVLLPACVSTKNVPVNTSDLENTSFSQITLSNRDKPDFSALTAGKAVFGAIGAAAMISAGNKIIRENEVADPADYIGRELAKIMSERYQISEVNKSETLVKGLKSKQVIDTYTDSGLVIDVQTINWSFGYFPTKWGKYRVIYTAKLRLIDSESNKLLAEGFCKRIPEYDESAPTKKELLADSAARIKQELSIAADSCIEQLRENVLQL